MQATDTTGTEERVKQQPYSLRKSIEAVKAAVPVEDYAAGLTELRQNGQGLRGRCPIHKGDNPQSFAVYPEGGRFYCYRCDQGGDVVDLAQSVEGGELWEAVVSLSMRFGVELPQRPESWHRRQREKTEFLDGLANELTVRRCRRYYKVFAPRYLANAIDEEDRRQRSKDLYGSLWAVLYARAVEGLGGEDA